jgi:NADH-ubiquinone oxidoreductase chain 4
MSTRFGCYSGWFGVNTFSFDSLSVLLLILLLVVYSLCGMVMVDLKFGVDLITVSRLIFFLSQSIFWFYVSFELVLLPISLTIFLWGTQPERSIAFLSLVGYSLISVLPLLGLLSLLHLSHLASFLLVTRLCSFLLVAGFLIKLPLFLVHYWLPKAHVEAPTVGSILLAGLLLKLGCWGLFRLSFFLKFIFIESLSILGIILGSILSLHQSDIKSLVAFRSVCHINFSLLALALKSVESKLFGVLVILSHALTSSIMFWISGLIFHLSQSRQLLNISGLQQVSLSLHILVLMVCVSNFGVPPFVSFFREFLFIGCVFSFFVWGWSLVLLYLIFVCYFSMFFITSLSWESKRSSLNLSIQDEIGPVVSLMLLLNMFILRVII